MTLNLSSSRLNLVRAGNALVKTVEQSLELFSTCFHPPSHTDSHPDNSASSSPHYHSHLICIVCLCSHHSKVKLQSFLELTALISSSSLHVSLS